MMSDIDAAVSFPEHVPATGGMVARPSKSDTRLSRVGGTLWQGLTLDRRWYLKEVADRGPGPRRCRGAVTVPHR
jgi:hypothetical protein